MVMHARKIQRLNDGYYNRNQSHPFEAVPKYPSKSHDGRHGDGYGEHYRNSPGGRGSDISPGNRQNPRYQNKTSFMERGKNKMSDRDQGMGGSRFNHHGNPGPGQSRGDGGFGDGRNLPMSARGSTGSDTRDERGDDQDQSHRNDVQKSAVRVCGDWSEHISSSGKRYFYNCKTEVSQWEKPKEWTLPSKGKSNKEPERQRDKYSEGSASSTSRGADDRHRHSNSSSDWHDRNAPSSTSSSHPQSRYPDRNQATNMDRGKPQPYSRQGYQHNHYTNPKGPVSQHQNWQQGDHSQREVNYSNKLGFHSNRDGSHGSSSAGNHGSRNSGGNHHGNRMDNYGSGLPGPNMQDMHRGQGHGSNYGHGGYGYGYKSSTSKQGGRHRHEHEESRQAEDMDISPGSTPTSSPAHAHAVALRGSNTPQSGHANTLAGTSSHPLVNVRCSPAPGSHSTNPAMNVSRSPAAASHTATPTVSVSSHQSPANTYTHYGGSGPPASAQKVSPGRVVGTAHAIPQILQQLGDKKLNQVDSQKLTQQAVWQPYCHYYRLRPIETLQKLQQAISSTIEQQKQKQQHQHSANLQSPKSVSETTSPLQAVPQSPQVAAILPNSSRPHQSDDDKGKESPRSEQSFRSSRKGSPTPSQGSSQGTSVGTSSLAAVGLKSQSVQLTPSLGNYYKEALTSHVSGWPADDAERQANRYCEDATNIGHIHCTSVSADLKTARSLVRVMEIQATLQEQRVLFIQQNIRELENMRVQNTFSGGDDT